MPMVTCMRPYLSTRSKLPAQPLRDGTTAVATDRAPGRSSGLRKSPPFPNP